MSGEKDRKPGAADGTGSRRSPSRQGRPLIDDHHLWEHTARTVDPWPRTRSRVMDQKADGSSPPPAMPQPHPSLRAARAPVHAPGPAVPPRRAAPAEVPPVVPLERRKARRIARGTVEIDSRLDLHGCTQVEAERRLRSFLHAAQASGWTTVLVITGKGARDSDDHHLDRGSGRGVLRRSVPVWLEAPDLRALVAGCSPAHIRHGGDGALYIHVRKSRLRG